MEVVRVLVVAAYASVRAGLHALLAGAAGVTVVGEAAGSAALEGLLAGARPDVVLFDDAPDDRPHVVALLAEAGLALVLLGESRDEWAVLADVSLPGWAYLLKDADADQIAGAVRAVATGLMVLDRGLSLRPFAPAAAPPGAGEALTGREREVLQLMAQGLPNKTIAARLAISLHTVKFHVAAVLSKMGASSRTEAVTLGARRGDVIL